MSVDTVQKVSDRSCGAVRRETRVGLPTLEHYWSGRSDGSWSWKAREKIKRPEPNRRVEGGGGGGQVYTPTNSDERARERAW